MQLTGRVGDRRRRVETHPRRPHLVRAAQSDAARPERHRVEEVQPLLQVRTADEPRRVRRVQPQLLRPRREVQLGQHAQPAAYLLLVARVVEGVVVQCLAVLVEGDLTATVVAGDEQQIAHPRKLAHQLLVRVAVGQRELEREDTGVVVRPLDKQSVAVAEVAELVHHRSLRRSPPGPLVLLVHPEHAARRVQPQVLSRGRATDARSKQHGGGLKRTRRDHDVLRVHRDGPGRHRQRLGVHGFDAGCPTAVVQDP